MWTFSRGPFFLANTNVRPPRQCRSRLAAGQVGSSRRAAGQHQLLEQVLALRLPALKPFHCRCQYQLQASSGWLAVGLACQGQLLAAGLAMPFKASGRPSRQFQASSRPTPGLGGGFALAFARFETIPLAVANTNSRPPAVGLLLALRAKANCLLLALRCPSRLAAGQVGSSRLAAGQHQVLEEVLPLRLPALKTLPLPLPISVPRPGPIAHSAGACAQQALRCSSRLAAGEVGSFRLAARQQAK